MREASRRPQGLELLDRLLRDVAVALVRERDPATEPGLLLQFEDLVQCVGVAVPRAVKVISAGCAEAETMCLM